MIIRLLKPVEVEWAVNSVVGGFAELPSYYAKPNPAHFAAAWARMMQYDTAVMLGAIGGNMCAGFLAGLIVPDLLSGQMQGVEFLWLAQPGHRKGGIALRLLKEFERVAKDRGCGVILCGAPASAQAETMARLYRRRGYVPHATAFRKSL
jgi:GNAT superfamily N-acetyltransferase